MSYIGKIPATGNFVKLDAITTSSTNTYNLTSSSVAFTPESANHMLVSLNGVIQAPTTAFTVSGSTITFIPASGTLSSSDVIDFIMVYGNVLDIGTPSDNTVSTAKLVDTSVTAGKLATDSVITAKIQDDAVTKAKVNFISDASAGVEVKGDGGSNDGYIQLNCSQNSHGIKLKSPNHSAGQSYTLTFPATAPATDKILQTNSSGVLSFVDAPSGGMTLLSTTSVANASSVTINPPFSSTYSAYKIIIAGMTPETTNQDLYFRFIKSDGSEETGTHYRYTVGGFRESTTSLEGYGSSSAQSSCKWARNVHNNTGTLSADILITNPQQSIRTSVIGVSNKRFTNDAYAYAETIGCFMDATTSYTQIKFYPASGNWNAVGKIMVYGLKE